MRVERDGNRKENEQGLIGMLGENLFQNGLRTIGADFFPGFRVVSFGEAGIEEFEVVVDLGQGADC